MKKNIGTDTTKVHPAIAQTILRTVESYGIKSEHLLKTLGFNDVTELNQTQRLVGSHIDALWRAALKETKDDAIGIEFANHFKIGSLNGLGFSWMVSNTLLDGFLRISRFFGVISSAGKIEVHEDADTIKVALLLPVPYGIAEDTGIDAALALFVQLCRSVHRYDFSPVSVSMQRPEPASIKSFHDFFQCLITYNSTQNELIFDKAEMLAVLPIANPDLARANDQVVIDYLRKFEVENTLSKVSSIIIEALPSGTPSIQSISEQLFMSSKTLQRRLKSEGNTFSKLLNDIRLSLAQNYLTQGWRNIGEICFLLGFTEPSNFARWFKGETGQSPAEYKKKQTTN